MSGDVDVVRTEHRLLQPGEVLALPPSALLGVADAAAGALALLDIHSVFDLATSRVFDAASRIVGAVEQFAGALYRHGRPPSDLVRESVVGGTPLVELQFKPIDLLEGVPSDRAEEIAAALDVQTVRELAFYPPFQAALHLLTEAYFPENAPGADPERPADLLPKTGEYPTERVQYSTLLLDEIPMNEDESLIDLRGTDFAPLDLAKLAAADAGFKKVAFGALLTFTQSWFAQGVTLGQLLHSTSLAPGESTRVAVIDWTRKSRAGETEIISEEDDLTNDQSHNRSISEVTKAVASEAQGGFSAANTNSFSTQEGRSSAFEMSAPLGGLFGGPSGSTGTTSSSAASASHADSYSSSWGQRNVSSKMNQKIKDRTHQHAHSSRSRRASVVKEVAQTEHESVSTRVLANYNHMHALTIQYYEVVQIYRVEVAVAKADRVVFIPVALIDFNDDETIRRFQSVLAAAALTGKVRDALLTLDAVTVVPEPSSTHFTDLGSTIKDYRELVLNSRTSIGVFDPAPVINPVRPEVILPHVATGAFESVTMAMVSKPVAISAAQQLNSMLWSEDQTSQLGGLLNRAVLQPGSDALNLPADLVIEGASIEAGGSPVTVTLTDRQGQQLGMDSPILMSQIGDVVLKGASADRDVDAIVTLTVNRNGHRFPIRLPGVKVAKGSTGSTSVVNVKASSIDVDLRRHLNDNRMHYSQAVLRSLDATDIALLLSGYGIEVDGVTIPVAQVVDPTPIRFVGNYLAFIMNGDLSSDTTWKSWLEDHGVHVGLATEDLVPLGSGGTFAEAVLGRSNCAEKLDITRFWNWQDSPTPLQPSEVAAIQTGSRALSEDVSPGQLSTPIINIASPTSLPDPTGTAAILAAIQNGAMFRDMSGLQGTIGLAQAALQATAAGASTAGQQAGENMNNLLKANTERQRIAAEMVTSLAKTAASAYTGGLAGGGGGGISPASSASEDGAKINYFDSTKGRDSAPAPSSSGQGSGAVQPADGGGHSGGGTPSGPAAGAIPSAGYSQNPAALAATWGDGEPRSSLVNKMVDTASDYNEGGRTSFDYDAPGIVPAIAQPSSMTCWATVATMMVSWKNGTSMTIQSAMDAAGAVYRTKFDNDLGLSGSEKPAFLKLLGLRGEPPMAYSVDGLLSLLKSHGPLWVTTDEQPAADFAIHARIVTGMFGDGTVGGTSIRITDPAGGRQYAESFATFVTKFEEVTGAGDLRVQVVHF